jgi:transaldolase
MNSLEQLKQHTTVVADTGDFQAMAQFSPQDATTNPSLILKAAQQPQYAGLIEEVKRNAAAVSASNTTASIDAMVDALLVKFGIAILNIIPGRVSTEVDVRLSFDTQATVSRARHIISLYAANGIDQQRILIKIAATWEGIQAAKILEAEGIHCNLTLLFSIVQAAACAKAGVQLISPFVGRIYDWHKKSAGAAWVEADNSYDNDPGVQSLSRIYAYYKQNKLRTEIMGASFRNVGQIIALAGCDLLTISPELLGALKQMNDPVQEKINTTWAQQQPQEHFDPSEKAFRFNLNQDAMATEKLAEGIRLFVADSVKLERLIAG